MKRTLFGLVAPFHRDHNPAGRRRNLAFDHARRDGGDFHPTGGWSADIQVATGTER